MAGSPGDALEPADDAGYLVPGGRVEHRGRERGRAREAGGGDGQASGEDDPGSGEAPEPEPDSLLADEPVRDSSFIGLFNGAPDLSERSREILREEFAKSADADR